MYSVSSNIEERLLRIMFAGFPEMSELDRAFVEIRAALLKLKASGPYFDTLIDLREASVLPPERMEKIQGEVAWQLKQGARKTAILVASALVKLQVGRMAADQPIDYFATEEEALQWLAS